MALTKTLAQVFILSQNNIEFKNKEKSPKFHTKNPTSDPTQKKKVNNYTIKFNSKMGGLEVVNENKGQK